MKLRSLLITAVLLLPFVAGAALTVTITSPKPNANLTNGVLTAKGTAKSTHALVAVYYKLNSGGWETATGTTNWSAPGLTLTPGANSFWVYVVDSSSAVSRTNEVSFTYVVKVPLTVGTNGWGTVTPNYNGQSLQIGKKYMMTAKGTKGFGLVNWTDGFGNVITNSAALKFTMASNLTFVANFVDITKPVCAITYPAAKQKVITSPITATCRAKDNVGVAAVYAQLNGGGWESSATSMDGTNWSIPNLALQAGTNALQAYAEDAAHNKSRTNTVVFSYAPPAVTGFAPATLAGWTGQVAGATGQTPYEVGFGEGTFAVSSTNIVGVGNYTYTVLSSNTVQLATMTISPPTAAGNTNLQIFTFTNSSTCVFTNEDGSLGTVTLAATPNLVPSPSSTLTVNYWDLADPSAVSTIVLGGGTFTNYSNYGQPATNWGTYSLEPFSPVAAMLQLNYTDPADAGTTNYNELTFENVQQWHLVRRVPEQLRNQLQRWRIHDCQRRQPARRLRADEPGGRNVHGHGFREEVHRELWGRQFLRVRSKHQ